MNVIGNKNQVANGNGNTMVRGNGNKTKSVRKVVYWTIGITISLGIVLYLIV